ncbi:MAG TPA: ABC transporter permease [Gemmatimonadaceae bacterium]|nr:ABC transporter permease [Gemmatimonadaceae bacterium]
MRNALQDMRIALRGFRRTPAFAVTVVLILGLGIGMAVAMVTVFDAVLLRTLPVRDQSGLAVLWTSRENGVEAPVLPADLEQLRHSSRTMRDIAGFSHWGAFAFALEDDGHSVVIPQARVTGNFFRVLGARPLLGRLLRPEDDVTGATPVMVISYTTWQRQFGGDSAVIGHRLRDPLQGFDYRIVGVAPPGLDFPTGVGYWAPVAVAGAGDLDVITRLAPGQTPMAAASELFGTMNRLHPELHLGGATGRSFTEAVVGDVRPVLTVLVAAVILLLVIACVNVGTLLLLRAASRSREIAIRRALGGRYGDIVRQLLIESAALGIAGGALGLACAEGLLRVLLALAPSHLPRTDVIRLSGAPIGIAVGVTLLAVLMFGLLPALTAARADLAQPLRADVRAGLGGRGRRQLRRWLVASQVALALLMLAGAGLLLRSLERLEHVPLGYSPDHVSVFTLTFPYPKYHSQAKYMALFERVYTRVRTLPAVESFTPVLIPPFLGPSVWTWKPEVEGQTPAERDATPLIPVETGGAGYFRTFDIPVLRGRGFTAADHEGAPLVVVVSEAAAHRLWPGQDAIGKRIRYSVLDSTQWRTVVGIVADTRYRSLRESTPTIYLPWRQSVTQGFFAIRSRSPLAALLPEIRRAARDIEPEAGIFHAETMDELLAAPLAQPRMISLLLSGFGLVALVLAALGLYGMMASAVREQARDIGVRMALGATPGRIRGAVLSEALMVIGIGAAVGLAGALAGSRVLASLLFEVSPTDPVALAGACVLLVAIGLVAAYLPARRATRVDPAQVLRAE